MNLRVLNLIFLSYSILAQNSTYPAICRGDLLCSFINQVNSNNSTFYNMLKNCKQSNTIEWAECFSSVASLSDAQSEIFLLQANRTNVCKTNFTQGTNQCQENCKSTDNACSKNCLSRANSNNHGCIAIYARVSNDTLSKANQCAGMCPINPDDLQKNYDCIIDCESQVLKGMRIDVYTVTSVADSSASSDLFASIKLVLRFLMIIMIYLFIIL